MKYSSEIVSYGVDVKALLKEANFIIFFNEGSPSELADISVLHTKSELINDIQVGDTVIIGTKSFTVSAVGSEACRTFSELGHATFNFSGGDEAYMPGHIMLQGEKEISFEDIQKGAKFQIF